MGAITVRMSFILIDFCVLCEGKPVVMLLALVIIIQHRLFLVVYKLHIDGYFKKPKHDMFIFCV